MIIKTRLLITGAGFSNKGAEAMLLTLADFANKYDMHNSLSISVKKPYMSVARSHGFRPFVPIAPDSILGKIASKIQHAKVYLKAHAILDISGYQFGDRWGEKSANAAADRTKTLKRLRTPKYYLPQAWGPFADTGFRESIPKVIQASAMAFVRDKTSMTCLEKLNSEAASKCHFSHDIAWVFQGGDKAWATSYLEKQVKSVNINKDMSLIAITPNMRIYEQYACLDSENPYLNYLTELSRLIIETGHARIIFMGHELTLEDKRDDRFLCRYLSEAVNHPNASYLDDYLSARQVKAILGCCDMLVSSRYHALIAALSQNVLSIALGWSHKYEELMMSVGLPGHTLRIDEGAATGMRLIDDSFREKNALVATISRHVPELKQSAENTLRLVFDDIAIRRHRAASPPC